MSASRVTFDFSYPESWNGSTTSAVGNAPPCFLSNKGAYPYSDFSNRPMAWRTLTSTQAGVSMWPAGLIDIKLISLELAAAQSYMEPWYPGGDPIPVPLGHQGWGGTIAIGPNIWDGSALALNYSFVGVSEAEVVDFYYNYTTHSYNIPYKFYTWSGMTPGEGRWFSQRLAIPWSAPRFVTVYGAGLWQNVDIFVDNIVIEFSTLDDNVDPPPNPSGYVANAQVPAVRYNNICCMASKGVVSSGTCPVLVHMLYGAESERAKWSTDTVATCNSDSDLGLFVEKNGTFILSYRRGTTNYYRTNGALGRPGWWSAEQSTTRSPMVLASGRDMNSVFTCRTGASSDPAM